MKQGVVLKIHVSISVRDMCSLYVQAKFGDRFDRSLCRVVGVQLCVRACAWLAWHCYTATVASQLPLRCHPMLLRSICSMLNVAILCIVQQKNHVQIAECAQSTM